MLCDNLEGWNGVGVEEGSRGWGHMYTSGRFMLLYGRNQHNIVKQLSSNLKIHLKRQMHRKTNQMCGDQRWGWGGKIG